MQRFLKLSDDKLTRYQPKQNSVNLFKTVTSKQIQKKVIENDENLQPNQDQLIKDAKNFNAALPSQNIAGAPQDAEDGCEQYEMVYCNADYAQSFG
jgi:gas vesicle protein